MILFWTRLLLKELTKPKNNYKNKNGYQTYQNNISILRYQKNKFLSNQVLDEGILASAAKDDSINFTDQENST